MREKPNEVVVVPVDRQPRGGDTLRDEDLAPLRGQGALAESRWPVNDDQSPPTPPGAQSVDQTSTRHQGAGGGRRTVFGQRARRWRVDASRHALRRVGGDTADRGRAEHRRYSHVIDVLPGEPL